MQVERKLRLCQEFLDVFGRVDPGQATDWWAVTQLEAIGAKSVLLQRDLESGKIPASAFKEALIGRVTSVVKFPPFIFKIQFTGCPRFMRISLKLNYCKKVFFFLIHLFARDVLVMKKLEIEKTKPTFIISVLKVEY